MIMMDDVRVPQENILPEAKGLNGPFSCLNSVSTTTTRTTTTVTKTVNIPFPPPPPPPMLIPSPPNSLAPPLIRLAMVFVGVPWDRLYSASVLPGTTPWIGTYHHHHYYYYDKDCIHFHHV